MASQTPSSSLRELSRAYNPWMDKGLSPGPIVKIDSIRAELNALIKTDQHHTYPWIEENSIRCILKIELFARSLFNTLNH